MAASTGSSCSTASEQLAADNGVIVENRQAKTRRKLALVEERGFLSLLTSDF